MTTSLIDRTKSALADGTIVPDGHSIYKIDFYSPHFTEDELRSAGLVQTLRSDFSSPKTTIFDGSGTPLESLTGIYNLTFLEWLASSLGVSGYRECFGRGSQAQVIVEAIHEALEDK